MVCSLKNNIKNQLDFALKFYTEYITNAIIPIDFREYILYIKL